MTVKVMSAGELPRRTVQPVPEQGKSVPEPGEIEKPVVYVPPQETPHRVSRRRRVTGSFGDVVFMQLVLSAVLLGALWAGSTFGGAELRELCGRITELFG